MSDDTDLAPSFNFTEAANAQIEAATPEPEAAEVEPVEEIPVEQPRGEDGKFVAREETPQETPAAPDAVTEQLEQLQKRLADKDEFISRQGNEIGELRKAFDERFDAIEQRQAQPQQRVTADLIDSDPATATQLAWQQQDQTALGAAFESWKLEDPAAAAVWAATTANEQRLAQQQEMYDARIRELEERFVPISQASAEQAREAQARALTAEIPAAELTAFIDSGELPKLIMEHGMEEALADPARQLSAVKTLFYVHRGRHADTLNRTVQEVARTTAEAAEQATADAYVASAATATATTSVTKTEQELIADRLTERFGARSNDNGWDR